MTEVAQVAALLANDLDDIANEEERSTSDTENKDDDLTHDADEANEDNVEEKEEESDKKSHVDEEKESKADNEAEETSVNGVEHEDNKSEKDESSKAVNGLEKEAQTKNDEECDANKDMSDVLVKKEVSEDLKLMNDVLNKLLIETICSSFYSLFFLQTLNRSFSAPGSRWPGATSPRRARAM